MHGGAHDGQQYSAVNEREKKDALSLQRTSGPSFVQGLDGVRSARTGCQQENKSDVVSARLVHELSFTSFA